MTNKNKLANKTQITNLINDNGNAVKNQIVINTNKGIYFQSYKSVVCFVPHGDLETIWRNKQKPILGKDWDYSRTTVKHLKTFLIMILKGMRFGKVSVNEGMTQKDINYLIDNQAFVYNNKNLDIR